MIKVYVDVYSINGKAVIMVVDGRTPINSMIIDKETLHYNITKTIKEIKKWNSDKQVEVYGVTYQENPYVKYDFEFED
ncbi:hypothetical protein [Peribacillus frigoritolerans]|jgi:hypothetical protein|uniref:hypothetical protein n=1 Tax=Peribacillus frigoritolerans TaxID=450367 RepID=UPI0039A0F29A